MYISYMSTGDTKSDTVMRSLLQVKSSGGYYEKDTPVPIPNTAVKLLSADDTWTAASRESRSPPDLFQSLTVNSVRLCFILKYYKKALAYLIIV